LGSAANAGMKNLALKRYSISSGWTDSANAREKTKAFNCFSAIASLESQSTKALKL